MHKHRQFIRSRKSKKMNPELIGQYKRLWNACHTVNLTQQIQESILYKLF